MAIPTPAQQIINNGAFLNDSSAEAVRTSFEKSKINFANIWKLLENQGYEKIFLSLNGVITADKTEMEYIAEAIENGNPLTPDNVWTIEPIGRKPLFYTITPNGSADVDGTPNPNQGFDYRFYRVHKKGQVFGGSGGVLITAEDVSPAGSFSVGGTGDDSTSDVYINLGDIGVADVWTKFNEGKPAPNLGDEWFVKGLTLITAIQGGSSKTWSFVGNQRFGIDEGLWGGDDITNPNYLKALEVDFDLLSNQPIIFPDLFVSKSSKKYRYYRLSSETINRFALTPEFTTFSFEMIGGTSIIGGFSALTDPAIYDGADIYVRNHGIPEGTIKHNEGAIPFWFKNETDLVVRKGDILHFKYNLEDNRVELVGELNTELKPTPFGQLRILKIEGNANANALEVGDVVTGSMLNDSIFLTFGEYVAGDPMDLASYDAGTVDYLDIS